jgi:hypothetical protein
MVVSCLAYSSTVTMKVTRSSETSVTFTGPEDTILHNHRCETPFYFHFNIIKCYHLVSSLKVF